MKTIKYVGSLSEVVMTKTGKSEAGDDTNHVKRGEPLEVPDEVAASLVGERGGWCWEEVATEAKVETPGMSLGSMVSRG